MKVIFSNISLRKWVSLAPASSLTSLFCTLVFSILLHGVSLKGNSAPTDINASNLTIAENSAIGTIIGEFNATDAEDHSITYALRPEFPTDLNPNLWLDASALNEAETTWPDRSNSANDATKVGTPLLTLHQPSGLKVMRYSGSAQYHQFDGITDIRTVFWVLSEDIDASGYGFLLGTSDANAGGIWHDDGNGNFFSASYGDPKVYNGATRLNGVSINGQSTQKPHQLSVVSHVTTGNVNATNFSKDRGWNRFWKGNLGELIILDKELTATEITSVEQYLGAKWNISVTGAVHSNDELFSIDQNGTLRTATVFDYESNASSYVIAVQAKDELNATTVGNFTVTLLDVNEPPTDLNSTTALTIAENQPVGTIVGEFNGTDPEGHSFTYSLASNTWETHNEFFQYRCKRHLANRNRVLNYETIHQWKKVRVATTDELGATSTQLFSVTIVDSNDAPTTKSEVVEFTIPEGQSWSSLTWDRVYGGVGEDSLAKMIPAHDGGYLLAGSSDSNISHDKTEASRGGKDFWLVKIDEGGDVLWDKRYGGSEDDNCSGIIPTADGNYLLYGASVSPADGDKTQGLQGSNDFWIIKIDENGSKIWDKRYGGGSEDKCLYALELENGDFALSGYSRSGISGDKTHGSLGHTDSWLIRVDENGTKIWDHTYGGDFFDFAIKVEVVSDGNWLVFGYSSSNPGNSKTATKKGGDDYWVIKVNHENGSMIWDKSYGGASYDYFDDALVQEDGSFIMVGLSYAASGNTGDRQSTAKGESSDLWVVKADANGSILWERSYGGEKGVGWNSRIIPLGGQGFLISSGASGQATGDISGGQRNTGGSDSDYWLIKIDQYGNKIWDRRYGGGGYEDSKSIIPTNDGGFLLGGWSYAMAGFDKTHPRYSLGSWIGDYWVLKLDEHGNKVNTLHDPEGGELTWSISGGADTGYFEINSTTGKIFFSGADYENPQDADQNNDYDVTIRATDASGLNAEQTVRAVH